MPAPAAETESDALGKWIVSAISESPEVQAALADLTGAPGPLTAEQVTARIYQDVADQEAAYPLIVVDQADALDTVGAGGHSILQGIPAVVRIISQTPHGTVSALAGAISDAVAGLDTIAALDGWQVGVYREGSVRYTTTEQGRLYRHRAIRFRAEVSEV